MSAPAFVIVDQNLLNFTGHCWEYDEAVAKLFAGRGHAVTLLAHAQADARLASEHARVIPWFSQSSVELYRPALYGRLATLLPFIPAPAFAAVRAVWRAFKRLRGPQAEPAAARFGAECVRAIREFGWRAPDMVFIQTVHAHELASLSEALRAIAADDCPRILVMLRREPEEASMRDLARAVAPMLRQHKGKVRFFADTPALAEAYRAQCGLEVASVPVICDTAPIRGRPPVARGPVRKLMFLGGARYEKGYHLLPGLISELMRGYPGFSGLEFHVQSYALPEEYDARVAAATRALGQLPDVILYPRDLSQAEYVNLLLHADIILLPYDASVYRRRSSGIVAQAMAAGKVMVVPDDTFFARALPEDSAVRFAPGRLTSAVTEALERFDALERAASARAAALDLQAPGNEFYGTLIDSAV